MPNRLMVIGGGIAGIQAATDIADNGVPVYLIESATVNRWQNGAA